MPGRVAFFCNRGKRERESAGESGGVVFVSCLRRDRESDEDEEEKKEKLIFFVPLFLSPSAQTRNLLLSFPRFTFHSATLRKIQNDIKRKSQTRKK